MIQKNNMFSLCNVSGVLRFFNASGRIRCSLCGRIDPIFVQRGLSQGEQTMNYSNLTKFASIVAVLAITSFSGCASTCNTCNSGGIFGGRQLFQNQPVRSTIRSWFQGDNCDSCNAPSGQVLSPNVAPMCNTCNTGGLTGNGVAPLYGGNVGNAQLGTPNIGGPAATSQPGPVTLGNGVQPPQM